MTIEKKLDGAAMTLKIVGRLDTATAPALEGEIDSILSTVQELTLECAELEYISSAGLRVLLKAQKAMDEKGGMKLVGVNEDIKEIFDITGFSDILTIE